MTLFQAILLGAVGCRSTTDNVCVLQPTWAVQVYVYDAVTREPAGFQATLVVRDGAFLDSTTGRYAGPDRGAAARLGAAEDRPGTYSATVRKPGYAEWQRASLEVSMGECRVRPAVVRADLRRVSP